MRDGSVQAQEEQQRVLVGRPDDMQVLRVSTANEAGQHAHSIPHGLQAELSQWQWRLPQILRAGVGIRTRAASISVSEA